jgi:hypothetical protein
MEKLIDATNSFNPADTTLWLQSYKYSIELLSVPNPDLLWKPLWRLM